MHNFCKFKLRALTLLIATTKTIKKSAEILLFTKKLHSKLKLQSLLVYRVGFWSTFIFFGRWSDNNYLWNSFWGLQKYGYISKKYQTKNINLASKRTICFEKMDIMRKARKKLAITNLASVTWCLKLLFFMSLFLQIELWGESCSWNDKFPWKANIKSKKIKSLL